MNRELLQLATEQLTSGQLPEIVSLTGPQIRLCARHLELVLETNREFNLTRIIEPQQMVIKHLLDSLIPTDLFGKNRVVLDLGSGAGFPGIPLAVAFPETDWILVESTQKKARFLQRVADELELANLKVEPKRGETVLKSLPTDRIDILTARAVGSIEKLLKLLSPVKNRFGKLLLYKGQRAAEEIEAAQEIAVRLKLEGQIVRSYSLPENMGDHCIVEYRHVR